MKNIIIIKVNVSVIAIAIALLAVSLLKPSDAFSAEYPFYYKSPRSMGMGGVGIAVGGQFDSVFQNPAGLAYMPADNWEVNLLRLNAGYGENTKTFVEDIDDAFNVGDLNMDGQTDDDELTAVNDVLNKYMGQNLHMELSDLTSMARGGDAISWGFGALGSFRLDLTPHSGAGGEGFLEMSSVVDYGAILGMAFNGRDNIKLGFSLKFINREGVDHNFSLREVVEHEDDLEDYFTDELLRESSAFAIDAGIIYEFSGVRLNPAVGVSLLNIGDLDFADAGSVPMTLNVGVSARTKVPVVGDIVMGLDVVDITGEFDEDSDFGKRMRLGAEASVINNTFLTLAMRAGLYQGYTTFGLDLRLTALELSYNTYAEEVGTYAGQDPDRRHIITLAICW